MEHGNLVVVDGVGLDEIIRQRVRGHIQFIINKLCDPPTQGELARRTGIPRATITKAIGGGSIGLDFVFKLVQPFRNQQMSMDHVCGDDPPKQWIDMAEAALGGELNPTQPGRKQAQAARGKQRSKPQWSRRFPRQPADAKAVGPNGEVYRVTDTSVGGLGIHVPAGTTLFPEQKLKLSLQDAPPATYEVAWYNAPRAGLRLLS